MSGSSGEWMLGGLRRAIKVGRSCADPADSARVLESIRAGKRLPEARFANLKMAASGQGSVHGLFGKAARDVDALSSLLPGGET